MNSNTYTSDDSDNIKSDFEIEKDFERIYRYWYDSYLPWLPQNRERRIAGSKRVERYQLEHGHRSGKGRLLQSITAHPVLSTRSFEVCFFLYICARPFSCLNLSTFLLLGT